MKPKLLGLQRKRVSNVTHYLFRYPAKFHPPVVDTLLQLYTQRGDIVLDPFVGSGTTLVETSISGRGGVGLDIDPVAVAVARAKTRKYDLNEVNSVVAQLIHTLESIERPAEEYEHRQFVDLDEAEYEKVIANEGLWVPEIPRLFHWFRRYVIVDLARLLQIVREVNASERTRLFLEIVFASIIRNSSNADPVPVSGLEYTAHMRRRDAAGRLVNPFALFRAALKKAQSAIAEYASLLPLDVEEPVVIRGDAKQLPAEAIGEVDAVLTSPPYHNAVDYYRRHQLEMFWLGYTTTASERLSLLPHYIGRPRIPMKDPLLRAPWQSGPLATMWETRIRKESAQRANDFRHYVQSMTLAFEGIAKLCKADSPVLMVVGHSSWNGDKIPTADLFAEIAHDFALEDIFFYPVKNRYMSYARRNLASIDEEYVLVFRRM
ncbi:DNA methyltransferase [Thermoactinospora rubra]|uniref:DNA methyltransferase n=1 Tax=Thermoactinospora rubra TaxID=1088767 RepID=UPI00117FA336|nr:DNA methyltransferase [Thermoactinospora rubra]